MDPEVLKNKPKPSIIDGFCRKSPLRDRLFLSIIEFNKLITIPHRIQKLDEVLVLDHNSRRVVIRMEAQPWCVLQVLVDENVNVMLRVVDEAEGGDAARFEAEIFVHAGFGSEGQLALM